MGMLEDDLYESLREAGQIGRDLVTLYNSHAWWSRHIFGFDHERGPLGPIRHLIKEAGELLAAPDDPMEHADCFLLILDASRRAGIGLPALIKAASEKLAINEARDWPKGEPDQAVEHTK